MNACDQTDHPCQPFDDCSDSFCASSEIMDMPTRKKEEVKLASDNFVSVCFELGIEGWKCYGASKSYFAKLENAYIQLPQC